MALAGAASNGFGQAPMSVASITQEAGNFEYDPEIPLRYWFRTADAIQKQAQSYERDGHDQDAYLFYMRHALLASDKLPKHPDFKAAESAAARKRLQKALLGDLEVMEVLKPRINERHERYTKAMARRKQERDKWQRESRASLARDIGRVTLQDQQEAEERSERLELNPAKDENHAVALSLANKELRRRKREREASSSENHGPPASSEVLSTNDLAQQIAATAKRSQAYREYNDNGADYDRGGSKSHTYKYPTVPSKKAYGLTLDNAGSPAPPRPSKEYVVDSAPPRPSKGCFMVPTPRPPPKESFSSVHGAPPIPSKLSYDPDISEPPSRESTATPDISTKDYSFMATAKTEAGAHLRTLFINPGLRIEFLKIAQSNTNQNLETCGILCGTLISNAFFVSKLVIPEQESTSDTCDTVNESALFDYVDQHGLMTLGWIHTHPTQTCFMSSRDLHTHSGYQVQMAESIAIVCAPQHEPSYGVFRLTDPPGLKTILHCTQSGLFHPHAEAQVYTDAMRPGHVQELSGLGFEVVDLRPK